LPSSLLYSGVEKNEKKLSNKKSLDLENFVSLSISGMITENGVICWF
jgi:hypothetical protein